MNPTHLLQLANGNSLAMSDPAPNATGMPIVFAHCLGGSQSVWAAQMQFFRELGHRTIAYDFQGHGGSPYNRGYSGMAGLADEAVALLDALQIKRCLFAGISMGGMVGLHLALKAPDRLTGLILADTAGGFDASGRSAWAERMNQVKTGGLAPLVDTMMSRWFTDGFRTRHPDIVAPIARQLATTQIPGYLDACVAIRDHDLRHRLTEIRTPTLVLCGELDPSTPLPLSEALAKGIPGATLTVLPGVNHLPCIESPAAFNRAMGNFVTRLTQ